MHKKRHGLAASGDIAARAATKRLAQCAGEIINFGGGHVPVFMRAASGGAHHARAVAVIHDQHGAVAIAHRAQFWQIGNTSLHAEYAVGHHPQRSSELWIGAQLLQFGRQRFGVAIFIHAAKQAFFNADRQANAIDDAGVVQFVGHHGVAWLAQCGEDGLVGVPTTCECVAGLHAIKLRDSFFQRLVAIKCAADKSHAGGARAVCAQAINAGLNNFRMIGQPQIIVATEARHFAVVAQLHGGVHGTLYGLQ